jgi:GTP-binding protein Era
VDEFKERTTGAAYIAATILVERESQKGIVIGAGGKMLKQIGSTARQEIETMGGHKVFLELRVKVEKDWRNNENVLKRLGYKIKH